MNLGRFEEARNRCCARLCPWRRVLGESDGVMLKMRGSYAEALYRGDGATSADLREA